MIRSITIGVPVHAQAPAQLAARLVQFRQQAQALTQAAGLPPRTVRLTLPPPAFDAETSPGMLRSLVEGTQALGEAAGARWTCLPLDLSVERGRAALLDEAQAVGGGQARHRLVQQRVVAGLGGVDHGLAKAPRRVQGAAGRQAGGGVDHVVHRQVSPGLAAGSGLATHSSPKTSGSAKSCMRR